MLIHLGKMFAAFVLILNLNAARAWGSADGILPISITEINLNWFGLNGNPDVDKETRTESIRQFLFTNDLFADVMAFVEIVDIQLLETAVLKNQYQCHSYVRNDLKHQHVVICHTLQYRFDMADGEKSYALEAVDINGHLRPAVHGILKTKGGKRLAHIFAVHFKAMPDQSVMRLKQTKVISDYVKELASDDPVILLGDVNTYGDDPDKMDAIFARNDVVQSESPEPYSWASASQNFDPAKFDRVWISSELQNRVVSHHVIGPCSSATQKELAEYNKKVSDHCADHIKIEF